MTTPTTTMRVADPPHRLTARLEKAIVVNEHKLYALHESGQLDREAEIRTELKYLNAQWFASHGHCFHARSYSEECKR